MDFQFIKTYAPMYVEAAKLTMSIALLGILLSTLVGFICCLIRYYKIPILQRVIGMLSLIHIQMCIRDSGYVQVPCIERNAVAAKRAYDAAKYAMLTDGYHTITLDQVMQTMKETGHDLMAKYRETAQGGLAKHFAEC